MADGALYLGNVHHRRLRPRVHVLRYRVLHVLVGYIDRPNVIEVAAYVLTAVAIFALARWAGQHPVPAPRAPRG